MKEQDLRQQNDFFSAERLGHVVKITFREKVLRPLTYLSTKERLFDFLDLVSKDDSIRVVMITNEPGRSAREEYVEFFKLLSQSRIDEDDLQRVYRAYDQFIVRIVQSKQFFVSVAHGEMILQDFNVDLACDYRIAAENTIIHKPYLELGIVPKGGGAYFLKKRLGHSRAFEILLSNRAITAYEALQLGIVDRVVPFDKLEDAALKTAQHFAQNSSASLSGTKALLNYPLRDLRDYLEFETQVLVNLLRRSNIINSYYVNKAELRLHM